MLIGNQLAQEHGGTVVSAFKAAYSGGINITFGAANKDHDPITGKPTGNDFNHPNAGPGCQSPILDSGGCTTSPTQIDFWTMAGDGDSYGNELTNDIYNAVHEFGHAYDYGHGYPSNGSYGILSRAALRGNGIGECCMFQQHPPSMNANGDENQGELYADTFLAWTLNAWNTSPLYQNAVGLAQGYMP